MSLVYRAVDLNRGEEVAIKFLGPTLLQEPNAVKGFINEARIASRLNHPNIVKIYDVHVDQGVHFLQMELLKGTNLREWMKRVSAKNTKLSLRQVLPILLSICDALRFAHETTVHRDLKPENIGISDTGEVKVMDFGLAQLLQRSQSSLFRETVTQISAGTPYYMAPELLGHNQPVDARADQFSLSVIAYELLTGDLPLGLAAPLSERRPDLPLRFARAIDRGLSHRSSDRFPSIGEFANELQQSKHPEGIASRCHREFTHAPRWFKSLALLSLIVAIGYPVLRRWDQSHNARQARTDQLNHAIEDAELSFAGLSERVREAELTKNILTRRLEIETVAQTSGTADFAQESRIYTVSNQLNVASAVWNWIDPRVTSQRVFIELDEWLKAARFAVRNHRFDDALEILSRLRTKADLLEGNMPRIRTALAAKDRISCLLLEKQSLDTMTTEGSFDKPPISGGPTSPEAEKPNDTIHFPGSETSSLQSQFKAALAMLEREEWRDTVDHLEAIEQILKSDLEMQFAAAEAAFKMSRSLWMDLFPKELGAPDLSFLADVAGMGRKAKEYHQTERYALATRELESASNYYNRWANDVVSMRQRTEKSWSEAKYKIQALGMRFIRIDGVYWSVWETRVMDFARWLSDNREISHEVLSSANLANADIGPTHPITGLDRLTTVNVANWFGYNMILQARPYGRLPTQEQWASLHASNEIDAEYKFGIFPNNNRQRMLIVKQYYSDSNLDPSAYIKPVGLGNPSPGGLYDLTGNAWEWSSSTVHLEAAESFNREPLKWILHGGGRFGQHRFHENEPPRTNSVFVSREDAIGGRIVLVPNAELDTQSGWEN
ncbi:MAG: protein kinase [Verrucomicrobia bacterium]|nr:protein kinase [Verrucomicrobiota bacterium]